MSSKDIWLENIVEADHDNDWVRERYSWVEESVQFESSHGKQRALPHSERFVNTSLTKRKARVFLFGFIAIFLLLGGRIFSLQVVKGASYRSMAEGNRQRVIPIVAERGLVYDRNGIPLTKNIPNFSLALIPQDLPKQPEQRAQMVKRLSEVTQQSEQEIEAILKEYGSYSYESVILKEDIDYETALMLQIESSELPGIHIQRGSKRLYLNGTNTNMSFYATSSPSSFSHILGYEGKLTADELKEFGEKGYLPSDKIGKLGVEKTYESSLRGAYGKKRIEVNAYGKEQSVLAEEPPTPGKHLILSVDAKMQNALERIIRDNLARYKKEKASGIVLNPQNGEVLALVSWPSFDNNDFSGGIDQEKYKAYISDPLRPLFHRAIAGVYPSGSVVKPALASAALQEGIITPKTTVLSNGGIRVGKWFFPDWKAGGHGITDVRKSIAESVNTFYYTVIGGYNNFVGLGVDKAVRYLRLFGFSSKLGIDIPGEASGFIPTREWKKQTKKQLWYVGDTYNLSIGQGDFLVTPLQIASMTAAVANSGTLYKPHVVKQIQDPVTKETQNIPTEVIRKDFIKPENISTVRLGMRDCVLVGSCRRLSALSVPIAGKTGTAQWNRTKANHAWFTSFAPFDNPQVVVTVMVEEGEEGSKVAAAIAYEFYQWWTSPAAKNP